MNAVGFLLALVVAPLAFAAPAPVLDLTWDALRARGAILDGQVARTPTGGYLLTVANTNDSPQTFRVLSLAAPAITQPAYALEGMVAYRGVEGDGYLELWNHFPDGHAYFSRTLAKDGPLGLLRGTSDWRLFHLPFYVRNAQGWSTDRPSLLELNIVLPARGTVSLGPIRLVDIDPATLDPVVRRLTTAWWTPPIGNRIGTVTGILGGLAGVLIGVLGGRGRAPRLVMGLLTAMLVIGILCLAVAIGAITARQPYHVWYPLLLPGVILTAVSATLSPRLRRHYRTRAPHQPAR
jgi:hypothetical protein